MLRLFQFGASLQKPTDKPIKQETKKLIYKQVNGLAAKENLQDTLQDALARHSFRLSFFAG
jgi:hypothetical protein